MGKSIQDNSNNTSSFSPKNDFWIEDIWSVLRYEKKARRTAPLKELRVKVGEWDKSAFRTYFDGWHEWHQKNCCEVLAMRGERDDRPDEILVQRTAPSASGPQIGEFVAKEVLRNGETRLLNGGIGKLVPDIQSERKDLITKPRGKCRSILRALTCFRI
jgi:hypothetical protein